jgi:hypothetical protein
MKRKHLKINDIQAGDILVCRTSPKDFVRVVSVEGNNERGQIEVTICDPKNTSKTSVTTVRSLLESYKPFLG